MSFARLPMTTLKQMWPSPVMLQISSPFCSADRHPRLWQLQAMQCLRIVSKKRSGSIVLLQSDSPR